MSVRPQTFRFVTLIAKNKINSTSNTSIVIVDRSRLHVSTLIGSSSGLVFETKSLKYCVHYWVPINVYK